MSGNILPSLPTLFPATSTSPHFSNASWQLEAQPFLPSNSFTSDDFLTQFRWVSSKSAPVHTVQGDRVASGKPKGSQAGHRATTHYAYHCPFESPSRTYPSSQTCAESCPHRRAAGKVPGPWAEQRQPECHSLPHCCCTGEKLGQSRAAHSFNPRSPSPFSF